MVKRREKKRKVTQAEKDLAEVQELTARLDAIRARLGGAEKPAPIPVVTPEPEGFKLDLACGAKAADGFKSVDAFEPSAEFRVDLVSGERWPFDDNSVDALRCSHFIEHIEKGNRHKTYTAQGNLFLFFFEEAYRILKPGGKFDLVWPALQNVRAFQDPTHCDYIPVQRMLYLDKAWRDANQLDHYLVHGRALDFKMVSANPTIPQTEADKPDVVQAQNMNDHWNVLQDWVVTLQKA